VERLICMYMHTCRLLGIEPARTLHQIKPLDQGGHWLETSLGCGPLWATALP
jgi:hypothetical protein